MIRSLRLDAPWLDLLAAAVIATWGSAELLADGEGVAGVAFAAVLAGLVAVRRRRRWRVVAAYGFLPWVVAVAAAGIAPGEAGVSILCLLLFSYAAGAGIRGTAGLAFVPALAVAIAVSNVIVGDALTEDFLFPSVLALAAFAAGRNAMHRTALAVELHEAALRAGEERDAEARRAAAAERRRIASEVHDVVGHAISTMVVQAAGARRILEREPARAQEAAAAIERTGRATLLEMRRLLEVMRAPDQVASRAPSPTLDGLGELVERARAAGLPVDLHVEGERRPLRPGLELGAYRVVQEALTEVMRIAPGAPTDVCVTWTRAALEIRVVDHRPPVPLAEGAGPTLLGVRERVALYGGELRSGQLPDGGHEVRVRFPLDDGPQSPEENPVPAQGAA